MSVARGAGQTVDNVLIARLCESVIMNKPIYLLVFNELNELGDISCLGVQYF